MKKTLAERLATAADGFRGSLRAWTTLVNEGAVLDAARERARKEAADVRRWRHSHAVNAEVTVRDLKGSPGAPDDLEAKAEAHMAAVDAAVDRTLADLPSLSPAIADLLDRARDAAAVVVVRADELYRVARAAEHDAEAIWTLREEIRHWLGRVLPGEVPERLAGSLPAWRVADRLRREAEAGLIAEGLEALPRADLDAPASDRAERWAPTPTATADAVIVPFPSLEARTARTVTDDDGGGGAASNTVERPTLNDSSPPPTRDEARWLRYIGDNQDRFEITPKALEDGFNPRAEANAWAKRLRKMREKGLICRTGGPKSGHRLTPKGEQALSRRR